MSGFEKQTYTQVPNSLFEIMGDMDECELKVVLYICRYTFGYHRNSFKISTRKMADAIGMNTASVQKGAELAEKRGLIERINDGQNTTEWVAIVEGDSNSDTEVIQNLTHPVSEFESQVGLNKVKQRERKDQDNSEIPEQKAGQSENFGKKKGDLLDGMLHYAKVADEKVGKRIAMQERAERELLRIRYNLKGAHQTEIDRFITFLLAEEKKGLTIEKFIEWVFGDEFWVDKISSLQKVMELFYRQEESKSKRADGPRLRTE